VISGCHLHLRPAGLWPDVLPLTTSSGCCPVWSLQGQTIAFSPATSICAPWPDVNMGELSPGRITNRCFDARIGSTRSRSFVKQDAVVPILPGGFGIRAMFLRFRPWHQGSRAASTPGHEGIGAPPAPGERRYKRTLGSSMRSQRTGRPGGCDVFHESARSADDSAKAHSTPSPGTPGDTRHFKWDHESSEPETMITEVYQWLHLHSTVVPRIFHDTTLFASKEFTLAKIRRTSMPTFKPRWLLALG